MPRIPSRGSDQFVVRFPDGLRERVKQAADLSGRSMNAEIIAVLEEKFPAPVDDLRALSIHELLRRYETADPEEKARIKDALGVFG